MDVRHGTRRTALLDPRTAAPAPRQHVACQSFLVDDSDGVRIEDAAVPGSYACPDPAVWRVSYSGALTDTGGTALRMKCQTCADSAVDSFGYGAVILRPV